MGLRELIDKVCMRVRVSGVAMTKKTTQMVLNLAGEVMREILLKQDYVAVPSLGRLTVKRQAGRVGNNPRTQEAIQIPATLVVRFKPSRSFAAQLRKVAR